MKTYNLQLAFLPFYIFGVLTTGTASSSAQFSASQFNLECDSARLERCQQDVLRDIQFSSSQISQYQITTGNGPPYSQSSSSASLSAPSSASLVSESTCRLVRSNLDCLLTTTPACYDISRTAQNTDSILRAKRFLEDSKCNVPDLSWRNTYCYRSASIKRCEEDFVSTALTRYSSTIVAINGTVCRAYQEYKSCVDRSVKLSCKISEIEMLNEYLIDMAGELSWRCPSNMSNFLGELKLSNYHSTNLSPIGHYNQLPNNYDLQNRPLPSYVGGLSRDRLWEKFNDFGSTRFNPVNTNQEVLDRLVATGDSDCLNRASRYALECENNFVEQQRIARESRDSTQFQRRVCCGLYQFKDCLNRVVVDRCVDPSISTVDVLMGHRRNEINNQCQGFFRDFCSSAMSKQLINLPVSFFLALIASIFTYIQIKL